MEPNKILTFIFNTATDKFLAVRNNPADPRHGGDFWFTVTGSMEIEETLEQTVIRELKEETDLDAKEIFDLNWCSFYSWEGRECRERNFISFVDNENVILNHENIEYEWLALDDFIKRVSWRSDKDILHTTLEKALNKELFFPELNIENFITQVATQS